MTQEIGQYRIISEIGSGGMGVVYRALDVPLDREVAIKKLRSEFVANPTVLERFRREAKMQARLNHPNIAQLYTLAQDSDSICLVMELVTGNVLSRLMPLEWKAALPVVLQVLEGLEYAHRRGVLHRDIKPENIKIDQEGIAKIMDFGIAYAIGSARITREKNIVGTLEYVAPERILGQETDERSDVYSLGVLLFEMIAGRLPFDFNNEYELLRCHVDTTPYALSQFEPETPAFLDATIQQALKKKPEDRFATCASMAAELRQGAAREGFALISIAAALRLREEQRSSPPSREIAQWIMRIRSLMDNKEFETAERLIDTALNDFPGSLELSQMRSLLPAAARPTPVQRRTPPSSGQYLLPSLGANVREKLRQMLEAERNGNIHEALAVVTKALQENDTMALRVAECFYRRLDQT